jgi:thioredoxin reductase (NADPH)
MLASQPIYDVLIVGAGPTGLACAIEAEKRNLNYLVIEKGCLVNTLQHFPVNMTFFTTPELLEIGGMPFISSYDKPTRLEALRYYRRVAQAFYLRLHLYETVLRVEGTDGLFLVHTEKTFGERLSYQARKLVLATGYYDIPNFLNVPGEALPKVSHYYTEAHPFFDRDVAVVGGKNSAALAALDLFRAGARVTLIHRGTELSPQIKYWIRPDLENRIKNGEITAHFETSVREILPDQLIFQNPAQKCWSIANNFVFALTGYRPDIHFFQALGIKINPADHKPQISKETFESNVAGIYLAGVVIAGRMTNEIFIENGRFHGEIIVRDICRKLKAEQLDNPLSPEHSGE